VTEGNMAKFRIPKIPPTTSKSIRFPNDIIEEVEKAIRGKECTFTAFVVEATRVALGNLKEEQEASEMADHKCDGVAENGDV